MRSFFCAKIGNRAILIWIVLAINILACSNSKKEQESKLVEQINYQMRQGRIDSADILYSKLTKVSPSFDHFNDYGVFLLDQKHYDSAIQLFEKCLKIDSTSSQVNTNLAYCYYYKERFDEAFYHAAKAVKYNGESVEGNSVMGYILFWTGRYEESVNYLQKSFTIDSTRKNDALYLGTALNHLGEHSDAAKVLNGYIKQYPADREGLLQRGLAYFGMDKYAMATPDFRKAAALDSTSSAFIYLAQINYHSGEFDSACFFLKISEKHTVFSLEDEVKKKFCEGRQ